LSDENNKIAVTVHHNNEVTVRDERGYPAVCRECRFSGWRNNYNYRNRPEPNRCLHHSGGADPVDGDRILERFDEGTSDSDWYPNGKYGKLYPLCQDKNPDGKCENFVKAKPLSLIGNFWRKLFGREWRTKKMRK